MTAEKPGRKASLPRWALLIRLAFSGVAFALMAVEEVKFWRREAALGFSTSDLAWGLVVVSGMVGVPFLLYLFGVRTPFGSVAIGALLVGTLVVTYLWVSYVIDIDDGLEGLWIPFNVWIATVVSLSVERHRLLPKYRENLASDPAAPPTRIE